MASISYDSGFPASVARGEIVAVGHYTVGMGQSVTAIAIRALCTGNPSGNATCGHSTDGTDVWAKQQTPFDPAAGVVMSGLTPGVVYTVTVTLTYFDNADHLTHTTSASKDVLTQE